MREKEKEGEGDEESKDVSSPDSDSALSEALSSDTADIGLPPAVTTDLPLGIPLTFPTVSPSEIPVN